MSTSRRPTIRAQRAMLRDGTPVIVRPVRADDARHADAFFHWLSEETRYLRFMYQVKEVTPEILAGVLTQDGLRRVALVVIPAQPGDEPTPAVAIGRYAPTEDPTVCEVAITVGDSWQGRGVGRAVLRRLLRLAGRGGYAVMSAVALTTNSKMVGLARSFGFDIHTEPDGITTMRHSLVPLRLSRTTRPR
ncbi:MAG: GNAT family N-acetyltransferase [Betaproteobacteria bacterium]